MQPMPASTPHDLSDRRARESLASRVRSNAGSAGLGAACLLFFGFYYLARPAGSLSAAWAARDWFTLGSLILNATMRWGGVGMACGSLASLTGWTPALLLDALVSIPIGVLLIASGVITLAGGGDVLTSILLVVFGGMFIRAGWRNMLVFTSVRGGGAVRSTSRSDEFPSTSGHSGTEAAEDRTIAAGATVAVQSASTRTRLTASLGDAMPLASRLLNEARAERNQPSPPDSRTSTGLEARPPAGPLENPASAFDSRSEPIDAPTTKHGPTADSTVSPPPAEAPPEGFLAAMARKHHEEK